MSDVNPKVSELFEAVLEFDTPEQRASYLARECLDQGVRAEVESLLAAHEHPDSVFTQKTTRVEASANEKVGSLIGRYKLLEAIGEGGFGTVWLAEQKEPVRRKVALKVIKLGMDTKQVVARFEAERQALALMDHPNIAKVLDAGSTDTGRPYFVMELVRGIPITKFCDENRMSTHERLDLFIKVCHAVQHAHQKGIIHRDLKPSNVLVTLHDGVPVPKVIDFGIAKATQQELTDKTIHTLFQQFIGTPVYVSPEQAEMSGLDIDTRSDIYSLGVLLYELLTGATPLNARTLMQSGLDEMRRIIREEEPKRPSTCLSTLGMAAATTLAKHRQEKLPALVHLVRGDLDCIVMKCLEKDRTRRYETVNGLASDLKRHLNNEPVIARPPSASYRLQKAWRRNKVAFTSGAAVLSALLIGMVVSLWQAFEASWARNAAQAAQTQAEASQHAEKQERLRAEAKNAEARRFLYVANMNLAQQAWEQNNVEGLRHVLEATQDAPHRGFEWYYWQRQTHLAVKTLRGHLGSILSVALSPDGRRIITGSTDHTAQVWDALTGQVVFTLKGHRKQSYAVAWSPDGQWIATGSLEKAARIYEASNGREFRVLKGHAAGITSVDFSRDGRIVTGSDDGTARVWDVAIGQGLLLLNHGSSIVSVAFSPNDQKIVTAGGATAKIWDAASGQELLTLQGLVGGLLSKSAFSPDSQWIVAASSDQTAKVWDVTSSHELITLKRRSGDVLSAAFSPDGRRIVTAGSDQTAKVWDATSGQELFTLKGHSAPLWCAVFSTNGRQIITAGEDQTAKVWDVSTELEPFSLHGHTAWIDGVAFSPDGKRLVTGSGDQTAKVWELATGRDLFTLKGHSGGINAVAFSSLHSQRIATASSDHSAKVWDTAAPRELLDLKGHSEAVRSVAFSRDDQRIVTGSDDQTAKVWNALDGTPLVTLKGHAGPIWSVAFSPDGQWIATGGDDRTIRLWNALNGTNRLTIEGHSAPISSVAFSPDGKQIVTASEDQTGKLWDAANGANLLTLRGHSAPVRSVSFSPDGQRILTGSDDRTTRLWEAVSGRELLMLGGDGEGVRAVAFSPDGERIAVGRDDQVTKVWKAAQPEQVALWQDEERQAAQYLAVLRRERASEQERERLARAADGGAIRQWLLLAPIPLAPEQREAKGLDLEQIQGEATVRPKASEEVVTVNGKMTWREVTLKDYVIDFNVILKRMTQWSVAYAVCYIRSETEQRGLRLLVGSDDQSRVYLNGRQIYQWSNGRTFVADMDEVPGLTLNAGLNTLVFKVINEGRDWQGSIRFTDADGHPVKGIQVTLTPDLPKHD